MQTFLTIILTGVVGILTYLLKNEIEKRREAERTVSEKRFRVYTDLIKAVFKFFDQLKDGKEDPRHTRDFEVSLKTAQVDLLMLGSDEVYIAFKELLKQSYSDNSQIEKMFFRLYDLVIKIRKDIGYPKTKLTPLDPLEATINDLHTSDMGKDIRDKLAHLIREQA